MQDDLVFGKPDRLAAPQPYLSRRAHPLQTPLHFSGFDGFGLESLEAKQDRRHGAVPGAGGGKRAVQVDTDIRHGR